MVHSFLFRLSIALVLIVPGIACGADLEPWFPTFFEVRTRIENLYQYSPSIASEHKAPKKTLQADFLNFSGGLAYSNPEATFQAEAQLELLFAESTHRSFGFDSGTLTARYQFCDDVALDYPVSVMMIFSATAAPRQALYDISSFHHGKMEAIAHLSVGKEFDRMDDPYWISRIWGAAGIGCADVGSPWAHGRLAFEKNASDQHQWALFVDGLMGLGGRSLSRHRHFHGYGPIAHRSVDLSLRYMHLMECQGRLSMTIGYRIYAQNFPQHTQSVLLSLFYPIGL